MNTGWIVLRGRVALALTALLLAAGVGTAPAAPQTPITPATRPVALVYAGHAISRRALARAAHALTLQVNDQLRRYWPVPRVSVRAIRGRVPEGWSKVQLLDGPSPADGGGYHDVAGGTPYAIVYRRTWQRDWTVGASHELDEMLVDPAGETISANLLEEVCDPVQFTWYRFDGMYLADFVTPAWYTGGRGPWDLAARIHAPRHFDIGGEEDFHASGRWVWIGPGTRLRHPPKPVRLATVPRRS